MSASLAASQRASWEAERSQLQLPELPPGIELDTSYDNVWSEKASLAVRFPGVAGGILWNVVRALYILDMNSTRSVSLSNDNV